MHSCSNIHNVQSFTFLHTLIGITLVIVGFALTRLREDCALFWNKYKALFYENDRHYITSSNTVYQSDNNNDVQTSDYDKSFNGPNIKENDGNSRPIFYHNFDNNTSHLTPIGQQSTHEAKKPYQNLANLSQHNANFGGQHRTQKMDKFKQKFDQNSQHSPTIQHSINKEDKHNDSLYENKQSAPNVAKLNHYLDKNVSQHRPIDQQSVHKVDKMNPVNNVRPSNINGRSEQNNIKKSNSLSSMGLNGITGIYYRDTGRLNQNNSGYILQPSGSANDQTKLPINKQDVEIANSNFKDIRQNETDFGAINSKSENNINKVDVRGNSVNVTKPTKNSRPLISKEQPANGTVSISNQKKNDLYVSINDIGEPNEGNDGSHNRSLKYERNDTLGQINVKVHILHHDLNISAENSLSESSNCD